MQTLDYFVPPKSMPLWLEILCIIGFVLSLVLILGMAFGYALRRYLKSIGQYVGTQWK